MFCWGNMKNGELGLGGLEEECILSPRSLPFAHVEEIREVGCGENHTVLVLNKGEVYSFGSNDYGQLGHNKTRTRPEKVSGIDAHVFCHVTCGSNHTLMINEWGEIFSWGSNLQGQLGLNTTEENVLTPKMIKSLATKHVVQVACGQNHSLALTNTGELYSWGNNSYGQLGTGSAGPPSFKPCEIKSLKGLPISLIAAGGNHSFAVSRSGAVYGWGKNSFGQLGLGDTDNRPFPTQLKSIRFLRVAYIACGMDHTAALTRDGGVFTFGAGMYGQLGHGTTINEMLPRQMLELMGSIVTQIACGRYHTLAFVPSRTRIYAFGLGGSGQLGIKSTNNVNSPLPIMGPWVAPIELDKYPPDLREHVSTFRPVIQKIFCGGDQSFTLVASQCENLQSVDYRERSPDTQILVIAPDEIKKLIMVELNDTVDQDLLRYVETVFAHLACYNGSLLRADGSHYGCCSKNHGIDLDLAEESFGQLSRVKNSTISELIHRCICSDLIPSLSPLLPDVEALRVHLLLPLYHEFLLAKYYQELHCPFAKAVLNLKPEAGKIIDIWWSLIKADYFMRLIQVYKQVIVYIFDQPSSCDQAEACKREWSLRTCLDFLGKIYNVNREAKKKKVGHECFYIPELTQRVDVKQDYVKWLTDRPNSKEYRLCNYAFVFDAQAKTLLLEADQNIQMQAAIQEAARTAFFVQLLMPNPNFQFLILEVSRDNIVHDTIQQLTQCGASDLKKPLKVKFRGEEAEDAGGVRKEFFMLILKEILDPKYGMFTYYEETRAIWFSELFFEDEGMYFLIGVLCGLAIYNFTIINLPFPLALYKKLLGEPVSVDDLSGLSLTLLRGLNNLLEYEGDDVEDTFGLTFVISREVFGAVKSDELKPGGAEIPVTQKNKQEYVDLYVDFVLNKSIANHFDAFSTGFHKVCGGRVLRLFQSHELMELVVGNENYDWYELQRNAEYKNGYSADHPTIKLFWEVFHSLSHGDKLKFLLFLTGSDRIPILGMKTVKIIIQRTAGGDSYLPVAHTCFNLLDLPQYNTKEKLKYKLLQAIQQSQGFALA